MRWKAEPTVAQYDRLEMYHCVRLFERWKDNESWLCRIPDAAMSELRKESYIHEIVPFTIEDKFSAGVRNELALLMARHNHEAQSPDTSFSNESDVASGSTALSEATTYSSAPSMGAIVNMRGADKATVRLSHDATSGAFGDMSRLKGTLLGIHDQRKATAGGERATVNRITQHATHHQTEDFKRALIDEGLVNQSEEIMDLSDLGFAVTINSPANIATIAALDTVRNIHLYYSSMLDSH